MPRGTPDCVTPDGYVVDFKTKSRTPAMTPHPPETMVYSHRDNRKHAHNTRHGRRERNHWFDVYKCPICGRTASHYSGPIRCFGDHVKGRKQRRK